MKRQVGRHPRNGSPIGHRFNGKKSRELMAEKVFS
jgi:ParB family chromosome partitioning protein